MINILSHERIGMEEYDLYQRNHKYNNDGYQPVSYYNHINWLMNNLDYNIRDTQDVS